MVYCGRPSAMCALCRAKRRRCDKATPSCGQCRRAGQKCPGYQNASSLIFRDETPRVINRARILKAHSMPVVSNSSSPSTHSAPPFGTPSTVGSRASAAMSDQVASGSIEDVDDEHSVREDGKRDGKEKDKDADLVIGNVIEHDHLCVPNEIDLFINDTGMPWESGRLALTPSSSYQSLFSSHDVDEQVMSMLISPEASSGNLRELGISYFLANYVLQDTGPYPGFLNYTSDILADSLGDTELAQVAICAVGLAGLASMTGSHNIMCKARASYAEAIERVNTALADSRMTSNDSTIFAVIVLGLFETITCSSNESMEAWDHHINGAANLLMHRGIAQFRTKQGLQIFGEAVSYVLTLCSRYGHPVPPRLRFLRVEMGRNSARRGPSWGLSSAHIEVMDLYHRIDPDQETPFLPDEWEKLLSQAAELDRQLENLAAELPISWHFKTVNDPAINPRNAYHSTYHIYHNASVAKLWNGIRACRIILNQAIYSLLLREGLAWAPHELSPDGGTYNVLFQRLLDTTTEMRDGILASVPQMLGYVHHDPVTGMSRLNCGKHGKPPVVPALGAYSLLWFLFLAGSLPINTLETRAWVVDRLRAIRSATGIQKAGYMADMIETHLGSVRPSDRFLIPNF